LGKRRSTVAAVIREAAWLREEDRFMGEDPVIILALS
jgi:hypothetical protein